MIQAGFFAEKYKNSLKSSGLFKLGKEEESIMRLKLKMADHIEHTNK